MRDDHSLSRRLLWEKPPRPQRIGLVLGGGAARGMAHIGVLQALEEYQLRPGRLSAASMQPASRRASCARWPSGSNGGTSAGYP